MARFDEKANVSWAKKLIEAGAHVVFGPPGLKTHCKVTLVDRTEEEEEVCYAHFGTGNYNDSTAKIYTDCGILTCDPVLCADARRVFHVIAGDRTDETFEKLLVSPFTMRSSMIEKIRRESAHAKAGRRAHIIAKMNSLCDPVLIAELYQASASGVQIELIVRGICCLRVGVPGISENITVRSLVGNYLEHSRIFYFRNNGEREYYMGSADWMPRNLDRRIEVAFPVLDEDIQEKLLSYLKLLLSDNVKARLLLPDGNYVRAEKKGLPRINAQWILANSAKNA